MSTHQDNTGFAAFCSLPAAPGIVHVLTDVTAKVLAQVATGIYHLNLTYGITTIALAELGLLGGAGSDEASWQGAMPITLGLGLTVTFDIVPAGGVFQTLTIQGYDI